MNQEDFKKAYASNLARIINRFANAFVNIPT